jgi:hypothetical protein
VAHRRLHAPDPEGGAPIAPQSTGLLLGWTSVASVVNVFAVRRIASRTAAASAVLGAAGAVTAAIATSRRGYVAVAAASGWALATSALNRERAGSIRAANALGATVIAAATAVKLRRDRRPISS